jgi:hypothetical protein
MPKQSMTRSSPPVTTNTIIAYIIRPVVLRTISLEEIRYDNEPNHFRLVNMTKIPTLVCEPYGIVRGLRAEWLTNASPILSALVLHSWLQMARPLVGRY